MKFEKGSKSYSNDQWLLCKEETWFNITDLLHALMLNQNIFRWNDINYTKKPVTERLTQTNNDFSNILGIMTCC